MTVKELRRELENYPDDALVRFEYTYGCDDGLWIHEYTVRDEVLFVERAVDKAEGVILKN